MSTAKNHDNELREFEAEEAAFIKEFPSSKCWFRGVRISIDRPSSYFITLMDEGRLGVMWTTSEYIPQPHQIRE